MFDKDWEDEFDKDFAQAKRFLRGWFIFVALLAIAILGVASFVIYRILLHLGVL